MDKIDALIWFILGNINGAILLAVFAVIVSRRKENFQEDTDNE